MFLLPTLNLKFSSHQRNETSFNFLGENLKNSCATKLANWPDIGIWPLASQIRSDMREALN
jgi:hypothetical protein